ncbi:hypothetical protein RFI_17644 [Reticulomyxa filosa]|uniref:CS domain-containing protein n=1 Tax=Reticulomyxa filosa TaxID=46433 RepID=X6N2P7_RETFI|nr:hypothetical protein RFI_17644 [Reticulomyxa filosa]|eukprot:ETO19587.1 hypothetical protein RFI_17644 [Reticulomyxa filosa]
MDASDKVVDISKEELERLEQCFKDREFRDMLAEYVKEISDPQHKLAYEEYLKQVETENQQPKNRKLMKPIPVFCVKVAKFSQTNSDEASPNQVSKLVGDATLSQVKKERPSNCTGDKVHSGLCWQIPYVLGHVRYENKEQTSSNKRKNEEPLADSSNLTSNPISDNENVSETRYEEIFDIAFSGNTIATSTMDTLFKDVVIQTAIEAVESHKGYALDKCRFKVLKNVTCKGSEPALMSVVVTGNENDNDKDKNKDKDKENKRVTKTKDKTQVKESKQNEVMTKETPKHWIVESMDETRLERCWNDPKLELAKKSRCYPKYVFVYVELPRVDDNFSTDIKCNLLDKTTVNHADKCKTLLLSINFQHKSSTMYNDITIELPNYPFVISHANDKISNKKSMKIQWIKSKHELKVILTVSGTNVNTDSNKDDVHNLETSFQNMSLATPPKSSSNKPIINSCVYEFREKLSKMVVKYNVCNIDQTTMSVRFVDSTHVFIHFETEYYIFEKELYLHKEIIPEQSYFNANEYNLLIMLEKKEEGMWERVEAEKLL